MSLFGKLVNTSTLEKYKELEDSAVDEKLNGKSPIGHTHDDRYYTEAEIDQKIQDIDRDQEKTSTTEPDGLYIDDFWLQPYN